MTMDPAQLRAAAALRRQQKQGKKEEDGSSSVGAPDTSDTSNATTTTLDPAPTTQDIRPLLGHLLPPWLRPLDVLPPALLVPLYRFDLISHDLAILLLGGVALTWYLRYLRRHDVVVLSDGTVRRPAVARAPAGAGGLAEPFGRGGRFMDLSDVGGGGPAIRVLPSACGGGSCG
ncbi:hypothetical protein HKX48_007930 [Thoreauomyces humboldtii]|nr:hypothetical protein HKX48_007930 [Thoreauomyces humboldtii]